MELFQGSYVALVTPFHPDGTVNYEKLRELCNWHVENGTDGLVVLGTTGESSTTDHAEDAAIVRTCVDAVGGRIPVIAGGGSNSTETSLMKSRTFRDLGVDGLLLITPYYNKANQKGMYRHFTTVVDQVDLPAILYNVPGRTGCSLSVECVRELSKHKNIRGIKEASGSISYAAKIATFVNDEFVLLSGNDDMIVPILSLGGKGVISVLANIYPRQTHEIVASWMEGDVNRSRELQLKFLELINALFIEVNPIPVKEAMNLMGMEVGGYRLPLCEMEEKNRAVLQAALKGLEEK
ncbi:MAG TPA: 4-hydroxy-tetrahydrodipicolinate synthase [Candidatus Pullichristensenella excrementigallinarum]|uniref:4-hydroxy-tetrahydrodipicolinate synthase n=1 Tax=Candidatus Pullichristensenella excrementigallinarum TaxID=2840907 RepID=A0A9D1LAX4_9FIRM|nr:4-hydroxy-tetrahydrodipicolinate synthase [Candidatus Pullichristensenella excrementigallinarum]